MHIMIMNNDDNSYNIHHHHKKEVNITTWKKSFFSPTQPVLIMNITITVIIMSSAIIKSKVIIKKNNHYNTTNTKNRIQKLTLVKLVESNVPNSYQSQLVIKPRSIYIYTQVYIACTHHNSRSAMKLLKYITKTVKAQANFMHRQTDTWT